MVHTRPDLPGRWTKYYNLNTRERRRLATQQNQDFERRRERNGTRKVHSEQGININEMNNPRLHAIANFQGWNDYIGDPGEYDPDLVKDFYAAMMPPAFGEWSTLVVRGVRVRITMDDICRHYNVPRRADLDPTYGIPPIPNVTQEEQYSPVIAGSLRRDGRGNWVPKRDMIKKLELRPEIAMWLRFVKCRLAPSTHYSTVNWYVGRILFCLQNNMLLDIGHIIVLHMMDAAAERATGILPFPSLITQLCRQAGVRVGPTIPSLPPFDRATYRAHIRSVNRFDGGGGEEEDDQMSDEEDVDVDYNPDDDEPEEPEDPRTIARMDRMEGRLLQRMDRGFYNLSLLVRGHPVPEHAFPVPDGAPDEAGPSNPRPARQPRRTRPRGE